MKVATVSAPPKAMAATSLLQKLALAWVAGTTLGLNVAAAGLWLGGAMAAAAGMLVMLLLRRERGMRTWALLCALLTAAGWADVRCHHLPADHLGRLLTRQPLLARVTGIVHSPAMTGPSHSPFARFTNQMPATRFTLEVQTLQLAGAPQPASGAVYAYLRPDDHRLAEGMRIETLGYLTSLAPAANPGEGDASVRAGPGGMVGYLSVPGREAWRMLAPPPPRSSWTRARQQLQNMARDSLHLGMADSPVRLALLDAILLGQWSGESRRLSHRFQSVGLVHLLVISGAHLSILALLAWWLAKLISGRPARGTVLVTLLLAIYLLLVPWSGPITRAAVAALMLCMAHGLGRRASSIDALALAALALLVIQPAELARPGFQLSFGITAGMILFSCRVGEWLHPDLGISLDPAGQSSWTHHLLDFLALNLVACLIALPIAAYHFQVINPLGPLLAILAWLPITAVLGLGFIKMIVGLILPSAGILLAGPLALVSDVMLLLVDHAGQWPAALVVLGAAPSLPWVLATLALSVAALSGALHNRRWRLATAVILCLLWLWLPGLAQSGKLPLQEQAMTLDMLAVGEGSCFLLRTPPRQATGQTAASAGQNVLIDCGGKNLDVGVVHIIPALRHLGVDSLDALVITHAGLERFSAALDVADHVGVKKVLVAPEVLAQARGISASAVLLAELKRRDLPVQSITRGWHKDWGGAQVQALWPPAQEQDAGAAEAARKNPPAGAAGLALSVQWGSRRLLFCGDLPPAALAQLLAADPELRGDVVVLPDSPPRADEAAQLLAQVQPVVLLQSAGGAALREDRWGAALGGAAIKRLLTARTGWAQVRLTGDGQLSWQVFRPEGAAFPDEEAP